MKEIKINESNEILYTFNTSTNLPVYMWVNNKKKNTYMGLGVKYGSSGTNFKCNGSNYSVPTGIAHYLEHIKFYLKDADASELFVDMGCDTNAYTSFSIFKSVEISIPILKTIVLNQKPKKSSI